MQPAQSPGTQLGVPPLCPDIWLAKPSDRALFASLWRAYLTEMRSLGSEVRPTDRSMAFFMALFDAYTMGSRFGVCLLAGHEGVLLWGEGMESYPLDTDFGRLAHGWGTFVASPARGKGVSKALREEAKRRLRAMGFDSVVGMAHSPNPLGLQTGLGVGFEVYGQQAVLRLRG